MVASDTLVGLVGAGILVVALAGVFFFESQQTSTEKALELAQYAVKATGSELSYLRGPGIDAGPPVGCVPPNSCGTTATVNLTLEGAPVLPSGSTLQYVASLTGPGRTLVMGTLSPSGSAHKINSASRDIGSDDYDRVVVSLETTPTPNVPSALELYAKPYTDPNPQPGARGRVSLDGDHTAAWATGSARASLAEGDTGVVATVELKEARNWTGFTYRAWVHDDQAEKGYRFIGNLTGPAGSTINSTVSVGIAGARLDAFEHAFVTLEPAGSATAREPAAATGGPVVYGVALKPPAAGTDVV